MIVDLAFPNNMQNIAKVANESKEELENNFSLVEETAFNMNRSLDALLDTSKATVQIVEKVNDINTESHHSMSVAEAALEDVEQLNSIATNLENNLNHFRV